MEFLSNLAWAAITLTLLGAWRKSWHRPNRAILLPAIGVQIVALAMLSTILLPVISITDDLHACDIPAEVERTSGWNHRHLSPLQSSHNVHPALALLAALRSTSSPQVVAFLTTENPVSQQQLAFALAPWSRPPPSA